MVVDQSEESDLRRRAAWLLAMLAVVAVLLVVLIVFVLGGGGSSNSANPNPSGLITQTAPPPTSSDPHPSGHPSSSASTSPTSSGGTNGSSSAPGSNEPVIPSTRTCSGTSTCALTGDPGDAIAAINAYRVQHGQQPATGTVTPAAQKCALGNGSGCSGDYAESQVPSLDGSAAVGKIEGLQNSMLKSDLKSFAVGWALDPASKSYFFAFVATS